MLPLLIAGFAALGCGWRLKVGAIAARAGAGGLRRVAALAGVESRDFGGGDFPLLERLYSASSALAGPWRSALLIRAYYRAVRGLGDHLASLAPWAERETRVCARYLAAQIERLLASNAACSGGARSL
jgi:hypothetical protein